VPVEVALFADAGTAWNAGASLSGFNNGRGAVASAGVAFRVNLFGFAIGEFDISRPFQRPARGWVFQFHLNPGF
jgi:outer membrane protein assembly factor BamA